MYIKTKWVITVDPDKTDNGVCCYNTETQELTSGVRSFHSLMRILGLIADDLTLIVEGSFLNKGMWHSATNKSVASKIGMCVGANHQTARFIVEMATKYYHVNEVYVIRPLFKKWSGRDKKITQEELNNILSKNDMPTFNRLSQDQRDAILLMIHCLGYEI